MSLKKQDRSCNPYAVIGFSLVDRKKLAVWSVTYYNQILIRRTVPLSAGVNISEYRETNYKKQRGVIFQSYYYKNN